MKKDPRIFLDHILQCIGLIEKYTEGMSKSDFLKDTELQDAVIRRIEIIGEAAKNLPDDVKKKHTDIEWKKIAGMRDVLIHEYFGIDLELTWEVVKRDIPVLKQKLMKML